MSRFLTPLEVTQIEDVGAQGRGTWQLLPPLIYESELLNDILIVPTGYITDFASIPRLPFAFWLVGGRANIAATLHDWLYTPDAQGNHPVSERAMADAILKESAIAQGCPVWVAYTLYAGVRIGGWSHWA